MADNEQTEKGSGEKPASPPAGDVQPPEQTKPSAPIETTPPAVGTAQPIPPPPPSPPPAAVTVSKRLFLWNLGWTVVLVISVTFWFLRHMEHLFTGALISGSVLTLLMALQIGYSAFKWGAEEEIKSIPTKLLGASWSRKWIIILLIASLGLHLITSSLYLEDTSADNSQDYTVEILDAASGRPFIPALTVTHDDKVAGKVFFFHLRSTKLRFMLTEPRGYEPRIENFHFGSAIVLRTPADFARKQFHLLRIVFGPRLWNNLAEGDDASAVFYDLHLTIGGKAIQIDDVRRESIDVGAAGADIESVLRKEDAADRRRDFGARLTTIGIPPEVQQGLIDAWETKRRVFATAEPAPGETVAITLRRRGTEGPLAHQETAMTSATIQTMVLEMP